MTPLDRRLRKLEATALPPGRAHAARRQEWAPYRAVEPWRWPESALVAFYGQPTDDGIDPASTEFGKAMPAAWLDWFIRDQCGRLGIDLAAMEAELRGCGLLPACVG